MVPHPRYEIVGAIASGDFATVYRGRDRELGREVAIKQIHQHFLQDPQRLESFWREAQLLASLTHPNIMTIYDLVRDRGWLILEFMQGNLQQYAGGQSLDPEVLRTALIGSLEGLAFLHKNGITHGDIKPSNLLIDRNNRVKLGDFGLARRASNEQGSLLKGTTKYMAPELVATQFGRVGHASDLYSLGFAAYELACGRQFDDLFPGLAAFGSDRQIAWMMWHAAGDRLAPPIDRVLPDFPADLAAVIQRLIAKPQSQRYRHAEEALRDLQTASSVLPPSEPTAEQLQALAAAKRKRRLAIGAFATSAVLSLAVLFWPGKAVEVAAPPPTPAVLQGLVRQVTPSRQILVLEVNNNGISKEIEVRLGDQHRVYLNDKASLLRDLHEQDWVTIHSLTDAEGREIKEVQAGRASSEQGKIAEIKADEGTVTITTADLQASKPLVVAVTPATKILINERSGPMEQPFTLTDLQVGDNVTVDHSPQELGRVASNVKVTRVLQVGGKLVDIDLKKRTISWQASSGQKETLPLAKDCEISLNGRRVLQSGAIQLADLRTGDQVQVLHDTRVSRIDAQRTFTEQGQVSNLAYDVHSLEVMLPGSVGPRTFVVPTDCQITAPGGNSFDALRRGDQVTLTHRSPDGTNVEVSSLVAQRPPDYDKWAILISQQHYDDDALSGAVAGDSSDVQRLSEVLETCYGVPAKQIIVLQDESRIRLAKAIPDALERASHARQLIVSYVGRGYADANGQVYLAPKEFATDRVAATGVPLKWFVDQLEGSTIRDKLLLFDAGFRQDQNASALSSAEMIETIRGTKSKPGLRTVTVLASNRRGALAELRQGPVASPFSVALSKAFAGAGDKNRDLSLDATELVGYFEQAGTAAPELFLPNNTPPRISEEGWQKLRLLAGVLGHTKIDPARAKQSYEEAAALSSKEPEAEALYVLVLLKARQFAESLRRGEELKARHGNCIAAYEANAWNRFSNRDYAGGINELTTMLPHLANNKHAAAPLLLAGQLREFAAQAVDERPPKPTALQALDDAVAKLGPTAVEDYQKGRRASQIVLDDFAQKMNAVEARLKMMETEEDRLELSKWKFERRQLRHYVTFAYDEVAQAILAAENE